MFMFERMKEIIRQRQEEREQQIREENNRIDYSYYLKRN